jgi:hypothetical protein
MDFFGDDASGPNWFTRITAGGVIRRNFGTAADGYDLDTIEPFDTRQRWLNIQFLTAPSSGNGTTYVDGTTSGIANEGDNDPGSFRLGGQGSNEFIGQMSDFLIYTGTDEANADRVAEVEMWLQRHRKLSTLPGAPFVDMNVESLSHTDGYLLSTWTNDGTETDLVQATEANQPTYMVSGGPEPSVGTLSIGNANATVQFDAGTCMDSESTFTAKTQVGAAITVYRPRAFDTNPYLLGASDTGATAWQLRVDATTDDSLINAGSDLQTSVALTDNSAWKWIAAEFNNTTSHVSDSEGNSTSGTAGSESHGTRHRIGDNPAQQETHVKDIVRQVYWDDGTTWEEVAEWVARRYPGVDPY